MVDRHWSGTGSLVLYQVGLCRLGRFEVDVHPTIHQLTRFVGDAVAAPMNVESKILGRSLQFIDIHDLHQHQHALSLSGAVTIVKARQIQVGSRGNQGNDLVKVNGRQFTAE